MAKEMKASTVKAKPKPKVGRPAGSRNAKRERLPGQPLTVIEFCEHYGIGRATFYRNCLPKLTVLRIGSRVLIPVAQLEAYEVSQMQRPNARAEQRAGGAP
jgi:hypothetical protein